MKIYDVNPIFNYLIIKIIQKQLDNNAITAL